MGTLGGGGIKSGADRAIAQLAAATYEERGVISLEKLNGGGGRVGAFLAWPPQLPVHSSQRKFIILFRNM